MQQNKATKFNGELANILKEEQKIQSTLQDVKKHFTVKKHLSSFNSLKCRGHEVSKLLTCLLMIPFYGINNIYNLSRSGVALENKDAYYNIKNNEYVNWRKLLMLITSRFFELINSRETLKKEGITAIIGDDSPLRKTGKKMENVSMIHDHVTNSFILGFKILVVGFWDGGSFIPLDFSIHRERGSKLKKAKEAYRFAEKLAHKLKDKLTKAYLVLEHKQEAIIKHRLKVKENSTNTNIRQLEKAIASEQKARTKIEELKKVQQEKESRVTILKEDWNRIAKNHPEYGLSRKEKKEQFKKQRDKKSCGYERSREADTSKISMFITMVKRAVKKGFVPDYVLTDTWFFCTELLKEVDELSDKRVKLLSMAKMGNTTYVQVSDGKVHNAHSLVKIHGHKAKYSRKMKAHYIKIPVILSDIRVNLFLVKFGQKGTWRILVTNDLSLGFVKMMEIYQLRWSIEVFFKECKQYLNLGKSCSSDFDGQVADATIAMIQHIMITFYKRMNYQQSFGELFKEVSNEMIESSLAVKLWNVFLEVILVVGEMLDTDIIELHVQSMRNEQTLMLMKNIIFQKSDLKSVA